MKIFIDSANLEEIKKAIDIGISGITTNPTSLSKEVKETGLAFEPIIHDIACLSQLPTSVELMKTNVDDMVEEAKCLVSLSDNIVIKVPLTYDGLKVIKILKRDNIKTNATLIFSANQAILAANVGTTFLSVFTGRIDDIGYDGTNVVKDIVSIFDIYDFDTEIIVASIRNPIDVSNAALAGADICTVPYKILDQMVEHPLTNIGLDKFMKDWESTKW